MKPLKVQARIARVTPSASAAHAQLGIELSGDVTGFVEIAIDALEQQAWKRRIGNELGECAASLRLTGDSE